MIKPIQQTAFRIILGLFMLTFVAVACNNKSEKKTDTDTTKTNMDTLKPMKDTTMADTSLKGKPVDEGD